MFGAECWLSISEIEGQPQLIVHLHALADWLSISEIEGQPQQRGFNAVRAVRLRISEIEGQTQRRADDHALAHWISASEIEGQPQRERTERSCASESYRFRDQEQPETHDDGPHSAIPGLA